MRQYYLRVFGQYASILWDGDWSNVPCTPFIDFAAKVDHADIPEAAWHLPAGWNWEREPEPEPDPEVPSELATLPF